MAAGEELADIDCSFISQAIKHFIYWNHGKLIYPVYPHCYYRITAAGKIQPHLVTKFNMSFDYLKRRLPEVLGWFGSAMRF